MAGRSTRFMSAISTWFARPARRSISTSSGSCPRAPRPTAGHRMHRPRTGSPWLRSPLRWSPAYSSPTLKWKPAAPPIPPTTLDRLESHGWDLGTFCFVIGADAFRDIETWKDYPRVLDRCDFAVVSRPGMPVSELRRDVPALAGRMVDASARRPASAEASASAKASAAAKASADRSADKSAAGPAFAEATAAKQASILLVDAPTSSVSSTDVRSAIARGASIEGWLPPAVADYIARHGLYQHSPEGNESGKEPHEDTATPAS